MIVAIDPSLCCTGVCVVRNELEVPVKHELGWIKTDSEAKMRRIYKGDDDTRRCILIIDALEGLLGDIRDSASMIVVAEQPAGAQGYRGAKAEGMMIALVTTWAEMHKADLRWLQARDVKKALAGSVTASKDEMVDAALRLGAGIDMTKSRAAREAMADAFGVLVASRTVSIGAKRERVQEVSIHP